MLQRSALAMPLRSAHESTQNGKALAAYPWDSRQFQSMS
jgi:hypothetical protein